MPIPVFSYAIQGRESLRGPAPARSHEATEARREMVKRRNAETEGPEVRRARTGIRDGSGELLTAAMAGSATFVPAHRDSRL